MLQTRIYDDTRVKLIKHQLRHHCNSCTKSHTDDARYDDIYCKNLINELNDHCSGLYVMLHVKECVVVKDIKYITYTDLFKIFNLSVSQTDKFYDYIFNNFGLSITWDDIGDIITNFTLCDDTKIYMRLKYKIINLLYKNLLKNISAYEISLIDSHKKYIYNTYKLILKKQIDECLKNNCSNINDAKLTNLYILHITDKHYDNIVYIIIDIRYELYINNTNTLALFTLDKLISIFCIGKLYVNTFVEHVSKTTGITKYPINLNQFITILRMCDIHIKCQTLVSMQLVIINRIFNTLI